MTWIKCPICELNYINDAQKICNVCAEKNVTTNQTYITPTIQHKGRNIFMVFQGKEYARELTSGYISAPYKDAGGNSPSHWSMLENVKPGDIIFHGLSQCISAVSIATTNCFTNTIQNGVTEVRQVNCNPYIINNTISTPEFLNEILTTCNNIKYQPFDKNGSGRQGYLFDLNDKLAGIFARALVQKNPELLNKLPELNEILNY